MTQEQISDVHNRLFFRLFQTANSLQRQAIKQLGMTTVQWGVLGALTRPQAAKGMTLGELADYILVSRQNLDGIIKRLERDGYVQRVPHDTDKRVRVVILLPAGRHFWDNIRPRIFEFYAQAMQDFRFDDSVAFAHYMNKLLRSLEQVKLDYGNT